MIEKNIMSKKVGNKPKPRHDSSTPGALVMRSPNSVPKDKAVVDIVVDPTLRHLGEL